MKKGSIFKVGETVTVRKPSETPVNWTKGMDKYDGAQTTIESVVSKTSFGVYFLAGNGYLWDGEWLEHTPSEVFQCGDFGELL